MQLCIDPGLRACGAAVFSAGRLVAAGFPGGSGETDMRRQSQRGETFVTMAAAVRRWADEAARAAGGQIDELAIELPQVYQQGHQSARKAGSDPNDLIHLAAVVGAICAAFAGVETVVALPFEWKGQVPKNIMHDRARARLDAEELARIPKMAASKLHNVLDAVALGLVQARRLG